MPLYEYKCGVCRHITCEMRSFDDYELPCICEKCGGVAKKIISRPNLVTDTNFGYTGKYDPRLGGPKIEGRKDFWRRARNKGLKEVCLGELANRPQTLKKRLKKANALIE
jgi:putative FmdB family regulatory protein